MATCTAARTVAATPAGHHRMPPTERKDAQRACTFPSLCSASANDDRISSMRGSMLSAAADAERPIERTKNSASAGIFQTLMNGRTCRRNRFWRCHYALGTYSDRLFCAARDLIARSRRRARQVLCGFEAL